MNSKKILGDESLDEACNMIDEPWKNDVEKMIAKYAIEDTKSSGVASKGNIFYSALLVLIMALFVY